MCKDVPEVPAPTPLIELGSNTESSKASAGGAPLTFLLGASGWEKDAQLIWYLARKKDHCSLSSDSSACDPADVSALCLGRGHGFTNP